MADDGSETIGGSIRTRLVQSGRPRRGERRMVNLPVYRASTVLFENVAKQREARSRAMAGERELTYGTGGTPITHALEDMIADLEGGYRTRVSCSGLAAISFGLLPFLKPGDHCLITEAAYQPTRNFATKVLEPWGVTTRDLQGRRQRYRGTPEAEHQSRSTPKCRAPAPSRCWTCPRSPG